MAALFLLYVEPQRNYIMETIQLIFTDVPLGLGIGITSLLLGLGYLTSELIDKAIEKRINK